MSSPRLLQFPTSRHTTAEVSARQAEDFGSMAELVEGSSPNVKKEEERQFYCEVVQSYRQAARRATFCGKHGRTITGRTSQNMRSCWR